VDRVFGVRERTPGAYVVIWIWIGFIGLVAALLAVDLGVFHRRARVVGVKEALLWSGVWVVCAMAFAVFVYFGFENHWLGLGSAADGAVAHDGRTAMLKFITGYVVEKSLSVDNIFVIAVIFSSLAIPALYQHRVLFWGILGAVTLRGVMIGVGTELISRYHWILYIFGVFLILTAAKLLFTKNGENGSDNHWSLRLARRWFRVTEQFHGQRFIVKLNGRRFLTPLALALAVVETTDVAFAVDSIPAIFAITSDPFLVFTSNVFALLGLRSLYFALAGMMTKFRYLTVSLAAILGGVGVKMLIGQRLAAMIGPNFDLWVLLMIVLILTAGVVASLLSPDPGPSAVSEELSSNEELASITNSRKVASNE
jgi:tellurite resistance protein TerC